MFNANKTPKTEQIDNTPFTLYRPHTKNDAERDWSQGYYQAVSIDPSRKNYGFRIERRYHTGKIETLIYRRFTLEYVLDQSNIPSDNNNAGQQKKKTNAKKKPDMLYVFDVLTGILDYHSKYYQDCHFIVIERQLPFNYRSFRIFQHTLSYFLIKLKDAPLLPQIMELDSKLKSHQLAPGEDFTKNALKKWSVKKCEELLKLRNDTLGLELFNQQRKQDDLADTVCQLEALFKYLGLPLTIDFRSIGSLNSSTEPTFNNSLSCTTNPLLSVALSEVERLSLELLGIDLNMIPKTLELTKQKNTPQLLGITLDDIEPPIKLNLQLQQIDLNEIDFSR